jgi:exodeoxyribonuclease-5
MNISTNHTSQQPSGKTRLSADQESALDRLEEFARRGEALGGILGPAGTGKTSILVHAVGRLHQMGRPVVVSAMTNKAAIRIHQATGLVAQTTYRASMRPVFEEPYEALEGWMTAEMADDPPDVCCAEWPELPKLAIEPDETASQVVRRLGHDAMEYLAGWARRERQPGATLLIDEASMCGRRTLDLVKDVFDHIVLIGDPNQLPPVKDDPMLALAPRIAVLETVHRHAGNSEVLDVAHRVLRTGRLDLPERIVRIDEVRSGVPLIVHENAARVAATRHIREALGLPTDAVVVGERLVCRENHSREDGIVNNSIWVVHQVRGGGVLELRDPDMGKQVVIRVAMEELGHDRGVPFRFGYVLTAHTAQGSEWPTVTISEKQSQKVLATLGKTFARQWRYTSVTRAKQRAYFSSGISR